MHGAQLTNQNRSNLSGLFYVAKIRKAITPVHICDDCGKTVRAEITECGNIRDEK